MIGGIIFLALVYLTCAGTTWGYLKAKNWTDDIAGPAAFVWPISVPLIFGAWAGSNLGNDA